jgi:Ni/Co efflux regulator RcnB
MKMKNMLKSVGGTLAMLLMLLGVSVATSTTANAQSRQYPSARNGQVQRDRNPDRNRNQDQGRRNDRDDHNSGYGNNGGYDSRGRTGGYGNNNGYGGYNNANQIAQSQGYQAGLNTGANDAQRGQSYSPQRSHYYRDASSQAFRAGFVQGYDAGFRQYSGYNNGSYGRGNPRSNVGSILGGIFGRP